MTRMRTVDAAVRILEIEGATQAFGLPGAAINPFYSAMRAHGGVKHILARHVEAADHLGRRFLCLLSDFLAEHGGVVPAKAQFRVRRIAAEHAECFGAAGIVEQKDVPFRPLDQRQYIDVLLRHVRVAPLVCELFVTTGFPACLAGQRCPPHASFWQTKLSAPDLAR